MRNPCNPCLHRSTEPVLSAKTEARKQERPRREGTSRPTLDWTRSTVDCRMSRPCAVTSSASGRAKKREAEKPRQPYMELAVNFSACCRMSSCCRRTPSRSLASNAFTSRRRCTSPRITCAHHSSCSTQCCTESISEVYTTRAGEGMLERHSRIRC